MSEAPLPETEMPTQIMVVSPTYNERENVPRLAAGLFALDIPNLRLLIVDDNSPDGTADVAEQLSAQYGGRIHVLRRTGPKGFAVSYLDGFQEAARLGADVIVQMDADLSHQPKHLPEMLAKLRQGYDVVIGSRYVPGGGVDVNWSPYRKFLSAWANRVYTPTLLRMPISDATSGYRAWRTDALLSLNVETIHANGYVFLVELIYVAYKLGCRIGESPIYFPDRQHGDSKMSSRIALEAALRVWQILWRYRHLTPAHRKPGNLAPVEQDAIR